MILELYGRDVGIAINAGISIVMMRVFFGGELVGLLY